MNGVALYLATIQTLTMADIGDMCQSPISKQLEPLNA